MEERYLEEIEALVANLGIFNRKIGRSSYQFLFSEGELNNPLITFLLERGKLRIFLKKATRNEDLTKERIGINYFDQEEGIEFDYFFPKDKTKEIVEGMLGMCKIA